MKESATFHITITDNETGANILDADTCAFIGAIDEGEGTRLLSNIRCCSSTLAATATGALQAAREAIADLPKPIKKIVEKLGKDI